MNRSGRAVLMLLVGAIAVRLAWTGDYGDFLQQRMRWLLFAGGLVVVGLGAAEALRADLERRHDPASVRRSTAPTVGWLLLVPSLVWISVAPTSLGASAVDRTDPYLGPERSGFEPLPEHDGPVPLTMLEFVDRAVWDETRSLAGREVVLRGFVVRSPGRTDGFDLTRFVVACCAADALPIQVAVRGVADVPAEDTWVDVVVVWRPPAGSAERSDDPSVEADLVELTVLPEAPDAPYESPY